MAQVKGYTRVENVPARKFRESKSNDTVRTVIQFYRDSSAKCAEVHFDGKADNVRSSLTAAIAKLGLKDEIVAVTRTVDGVKKVYLSK